MIEPNDQHKYQHSQSAQVSSMLNLDGRVFVKGSRRSKLLISDLYHTLLLMTWPQFIALISGSYLLINVFFAVIYYLCGPDSLDGVNKFSEWGRFSDCFFFSVQTLATIGYGHISPVGFWSNSIVTVQAFLDILTVAILTGIFYGRFAKATARVIFSKYALISSFNGKSCLIFRVANERLNQIVESRMTVTLTQNEVSTEGEKARRLYDLELERNYSPLFSLSWTVRHFIDSRSPLYGLDQTSMQERQIVLLASMTGIDGTFSQMITARKAYSYDEVLYSKRFKDIIFWDKSKVHIKLEDIDETIDLP